MRLLTAVLVTVVLASPATAQSWRNPSGESQGESPQRFVDELDALIDQAERSRSADPRFLWDLRNLARRYDRPWRVEVLRDDFRDGDYVRGPAWSVVSGRFVVDRGWGLRSVVTPPVAAATAQDEQGTQQSGRDKLAGALLGAILQQAMRGQQGDQPQRQAAPETRAEIRTAARITNAFSIKLNFSSWQGRGRMEFGPYGTGGQGGYRLAYNPGARPALQLLRLTGLGSAVIDAYSEPLSLEDSRQHSIEWTRDRVGDMVVRLDGNEVMRTTDRALGEVFEGFAFVNLGGEYGVHEVAILGTQGR